MLANRVREFSITEGTGNVTLSGALAGHVRFSDAFAPGDSVIYVIEDGDNYEIGTGTLLDANTLVRSDISETLVVGTLTRGGTSPIPLSGQAKIYCAATAEFLLGGDVETGVIREVSLGAGVDVDGALRLGSDLAGQSAVFAGAVRSNTKGSLAEPAFQIDTDAIGGAVGIGGGADVGAEHLQAIVAGAVGWQQTSTLFDIKTAMQVAGDVILGEGTDGQLRVLNSGAITAGEWWLQVRDSGDFQIRDNIGLRNIVEIDRDTGLVGLNYGLNVGGDVSLTGRLALRVGGGNWFNISANSAAAGNFGTFKKVDGTTNLAFIGGGAGAAISAGTADDFAIRAEGDLYMAAGGNNPVLTLGALQNAAFAGEVSATTAVNNGGMTLENNGQNNVAYMLTDAVTDKGYRMSYNKPNDKIEWAKTDGTGRAGINTIMALDDSLLDISTAVQVAGDVTHSDLVSTGSGAWKSTDNSSFKISGGDANGAGANITTYGQLHATNANNIRFSVGASTKLLWDDSSSYWNFYSSNLQNIGNIHGDVDTGVTEIYGGPTTASANILLYGGTHATKAYDIHVRSGSTNRLWYDNSSDLWKVGSGGVVRTVATASMWISGGTGVSSGGAIRLFGESHSTQANDIMLMSGGNTKLLWDNSILAWNYGTNIITGVSDMRRGTATGSMFISGGSNLNNGSNIVLHGEAHATKAGFTDFRSSGSVVWQINGSGQLVAAGNSRSIQCIDNTGTVNLSGGNATNVGANVIFYSGAHATNPGDILFRTSSTNVLLYDDSASIWDFQNNAVSAGEIRSVGSLPTFRLQDTDVSTNAYIYGNDGIVGLDAQAGKWIRAMVGGVEYNRQSETLFDIKTAMQVASNITQSTLAPLNILADTDSSLTAAQVIGGHVYSKADPSGAGSGIVGGMRMVAEGSVGASTYLAFYTSNASSNDVEFMRGNSDLSVTFAGELQVAGNITTQATGTASVFISLDNNGTLGRQYDIGSASTGYGKAGAFYIYDVTAGAERFSINSAGNAALSGELQVAGNITQSTLAPLNILADTDSSLTAAQVIGGHVYSKADPSGAGSGIVGGMRMVAEGSVGASTYLAFYTSNASSNDVEFMRGNSDLSATFAGELQVAGNITTQATGTASAFISLDNNGTLGRQYDIGSASTDYGNAGAFYIYDVTAGAERVRIDSVGTTTFSGQIDVVQSGGVMMTFNRTVASNDDNFSIIMSSEGSAATDFIALGVGTDALRVYGNDLVKAASNLEVQGNLNVAGSTAFGADIWPTTSIARSAGRFGLFNDTGAAYMVVAEMQANQQAGRGGRLRLGSRATDGALDMAATEIAGLKTNSNNGDFASYLSFSVMDSSSTLSEKWRMSDNELVGENGRVIRRGTNADYMIISGGVSGSSGARHQLMGGSHVNANDWYFYTDGTQQMAYDNSQNVFDYKSNDIVTTGLISSKFGSIRPDLAGLNPGTRFFDTSLDKPIYVNAAQNGWVDAIGSAVT